MNLDIQSLILALAAGMISGFAYFGGLRFTIQRLRVTRHPVAMVLSSFLLRLGGCLIGFYLIMGGHWERLALALLGFFLIRSFLLYKWGPNQLNGVTVKP